MEVIKKEELKLISGAASYPTYPRDVNDPRVIACNNGIIGGVIAGIPGGPYGMALGLLGGAFAGGCFNR